MENQAIREQIFDALFDYTEKWGSICTESDCATVRDEICLRIDQSKFTADEAEEHINQEVEKRIAERMPSDGEITHEATDRYANKVTGHVRSNLWAAFRKGAKWSRSRMMKISSSQKTEGGGE